MRGNLCRIFRLMEKPGNFSCENEMANIPADRADRFVNALIFMKPFGKRSFFSTDRRCEKHAPTPLSHFGNAALGQSGG